MLWVMISNFLPATNALDPLSAFTEVSVEVNLRIKKAGCNWYLALNFNLLENGIKKAIGRLAAIV